MGLHEPHAGKSYLSRESVDCLRVAGPDAQHDRRHPDHGQDDERNPALHAQNRLMSCSFAPVKGDSNRHTPPEQV
jgi:hypothetical protein